MPRSRMIKPEFWDDEKLATISRDARLTFIGMWTHSDDYGVVKGHPAWLKNKIYPYEEIKQSEFQKWLNELEKLLCILPFECEGEKYFYIRAFIKHQVINRPSQQRNPEPPQQIIDDSMNTHGVLTDETETETETETEKKPKKKASGKPDFCLPPEIDEQVWKEFVIMRKEIKAPLTNGAIKLTLEELEKIHIETGQDKNDILKQSIFKSWRGLFPLKKDYNEGRGFLDS